MAKYKIYCYHHPEGDIYTAYDEDHWPFCIGFTEDECMAAVESIIALKRAARQTTKGTLIKEIEL